MTTLQMPYRPTDCLTCQFRPQRMFCNLPPHALADFNTLGALALLPTGAVLLHEGDPADRVVIICNGHAMLSCGSSGGRRLNVKVSLPGDLIGLGACMSGSRSEVTAVTLEPALVKIVSRAQFLPFLERQGSACLHAAVALAEENKSAFQAARRIALSGSIAGRVANLLLDWGRSASHGKATFAFEMKFTHDDLAGFVGSSRETITRTLGSFQDKDLISIRGASVQVLSEARLARIAG
jgi:CRP/FNR family transcriptional regulator